jgi:hypothetical protein
LPRLPSAYVTYGCAPPDAIRAAPAAYHLDRFDEIVAVLDERPGRIA